MSLDFVIIPFNSTFEESSLTIITQIQDSIEHISLSLDTDYSKSYNSRKNKWKQDDYNIIMINQDFIESGYINVTISGNQEKMSVQEFIDLVSNFEHTEDDDEDSDKTDEEDYCIIC
jgi:hypothetical protein